MNEINKTTYMLKKRNDATNRIDHLATLSSPPDLEKVRKQFGEGKYLVFLVRKGEKGIRKYIGFSVDKNGKIVEGTTPLAKDNTQGVGIPKKGLEITEKGIKKGVEVVKKTPDYIEKITPTVKYKKVLIKSEIIKKGGKHVRKDYYKTVPVVPVTMTGMSSEVEKEKTEDKKTDNELKECIVSKDTFADDAMMFISTLIISAGAYFGLSIWKNQTKK